MYKRAICEHLAYNDDHFIRFDKPKSISAELHFVPKLVREAIEIKMHSNFNRDQSFNLSSAQGPLLNTIKLNRKHTEKKLVQADAISFA